VAMLVSKEDICPTRRPIRHGLLQRATLQAEGGTLVVHMGQEVIGAAPSEHICSRIACQTLGTLIPVCYCPVEVHEIDTFVKTVQNLAVEIFSCTHPAMPFLWFRIDSHGQARRTNNTRRANSACIHPRLKAWSSAGSSLAVRNISSEHGEPGTRLRVGLCRRRGRREPQEWTGTDGSPGHRVMPAQSVPEKGRGAWAKRLTLIRG